MNRPARKLDDNDELSRFNQQNLGSFAFVMSKLAIKIYTVILNLINICKMRLTLFYIVDYKNLNFETL